MSDIAMLSAIIQGRRSLRRFAPHPVPYEVLLSLLEAACWAPSAHNRQPWRFVVVAGQEARERLIAVMTDHLRADLAADGTPEEDIRADTERSRQRLSTAPALILICLSMQDMDRYPDARRQGFEHTMAVQSVAMAAQNLLLAAHARGLGAVWMCAPLFCQSAVRQALDLPDDYEPQGMIALGYPAQERAKTRAPLETRVIFR
ncbi:MAG: nitroreductase family protein [Anaerolineae bacterium]